MFSSSGKQGDFNRPRQDTRHRIGINLQSQNVRLHIRHYGLGIPRMRRLNQA